MQIHPNEIVRLKDAYRYFGYTETQLAEKVRAGEIPPPMSLSATGRAKGWLGSQIIEYQARLMARHNKTAA
jgi:predicted DNA-binding transcriptional regulator AlpA